MTKYRAQKTECAAKHIHASKKEAARCDDLLALEALGQIQGLINQPEFEVVVNQVRVCTYVADFAYLIGDCQVVEDVKGYRTDVYRLKKKLVEAAYPGTVITEYPPRRRKKRKKRAVPAIT